MNEWHKADGPDVWYAGLSVLCEYGSGDVLNRGGQIGSSSLLNGYLRTISPVRAMKLNSTDARLIQLVPSLTFIKVQFS